MNKTAAILATVCALTATSAHAWGSREQGILTGIAGTLILQQIYKPQPQSQPTPPPVVHHYPAPVYQAPQPIYRWVDVYIPECRCYRSVMVQIN